MKNSIFLFCLLLNALWNTINYVQINTKLNFILLPYFFVNHLRIIASYLMIPQKRSHKEINFLFNDGHNCMKVDHRKVILYVICRCDFSVMTYSLINYLIMAGQNLNSLYRRGLYTQRSWYSIKYAELLIMCWYYSF